MPGRGRAAPDLRVLLRQLGRYGPVRRGERLFDLFGHELRFLRRRIRALEPFRQSYTFLRISCRALCGSVKVGLRAEPALQSLRTRYTFSRVSLCTSPGREGTLEFFPVPLSVSRPSILPRTGLRGASLQGLPGTDSCLHAPSSTPGGPSARRRSGPDRRRFERIPRRPAGLRSGDR